MTPSKFRLGLFLVVLVIIFDQGSKIWIVDVIMQPPKKIPISDFFNLVLTYNRGVSFGLLDMQAPFGRWILTAISLTITCALFVWMWRAEKKLIVAALGLIIGGALGNVIDRLTAGAVVDFLDFHWASYHWPAFNVADMAISCGAIIIITESFFSSHQKL